MRNSIDHQIDDYEKEIEGSFEWEGSSYSFSRVKRLER